MGLNINNNAAALQWPTLTKKVVAGAMAVAMAVSAYAGVASAATQTVEPTNFNTHSGTDYKGVNVGFKVTSDEPLDSVEVSLLSGDEILVTNEGTQYLLDSYTVDSTTEFSTPFITYYGTYDTTDPYWDFGDWETLDQQPDRALIVVNGQEVYNNTLTEANGWTFESLMPELNGENFNTHAGADYQGVNVGFNADGFEEFNSVEVSLYDANDNLLVTNTGTEDLFNLYANGTNQFSTPFVTSLGSYDLQGDTYWEFGDWSSFTEPAYATVTVNGQTVLLENLTGPAFDELDFDNYALLSKEACKNGGYRMIMNDDQMVFKNQGQCVAATVSSDNSRHNR